MIENAQKATSTVVAKINNVDILVLNDPEQPVPIKPICDLFGIAIQGQIEKIKNDEFWVQL